MLPLRRDRLILGIARDHLEWARCQGLITQRVIAQGVEKFEDGVFQSDTWQQAIFVRMHECIARPEWSNADVTVVLSGDIVRYLAFIAPKDVSRTDELNVYAQHQFSKVYGEAAQHWQVRLHRSKKTAYLACALSSQWLEELRTIFQSNQHLVSIQPVFMASFNSYHKALPRKGWGWYVCYENKQFTYALFGNGQWQYVQTRRGEQLVDLLQWLERENVSGHLSQPCREIWLENTLFQAASDATYNFHSLPIRPLQGIDSMEYALISLGMH